MSKEPLSDPRLYFSTNSIRDRYAQHISEKPRDSDPLMDIARDTVELMRRDEKSDKEIRSVLAEKFHFSDATIDTLLCGKQ